MMVIIHLWPSLYLNKLYCRLPTTAENVGDVGQRLCGSTLAQQHDRPTSLPAASQMAHLRGWQNTAGEYSPSFEIFWRVQLMFHLLVFVYSFVTFLCL